MSDKQKFPRAVALNVARELCLRLADDCVRLLCCGSLRRRKAEVGDVELVFIPDTYILPENLFESRLASRVDQRLGELLAAGIIAKRRNVNGSETWGEKNKLAVHVASGVPVDFFSTSEECWFNYVVFRTGGAVSNTQIAGAALRMGWKWNPYGPGFTDLHGEIVRMKSEQEVFACAGLPYKEPWERA